MIMTRTAASAAAIIATAVSGPVAAQLVLEIDQDSGRDVINDGFRAMSIIDRYTAIDHDRSILYVRDAEEPEGVMAFSLVTGQWLGTYSAPTGDGPQELGRGIASLVPRADGGLYVSGQLRVLQFDSTSRVVASWQPTAPPRNAVCEFGGAPAIPTRGGVIRRGPGGVDQSIGAGALAEYEIRARTVEEGIADARRLASARLSCTDRAAYLVLSYEGGPDSVFVYTRDGREGRLDVPIDFATAPTPWNRRLAPSDDGRGNIVLAGRDPEVPGAIVDPESGCYAVLLHREPTIYRRLMGIVRDSALVFHRDREETTEDGKKVVRLYTEARQVSLRPLRRVSGELCPGMLTSVENEPY